MRNQSIGRKIVSVLLSGTCFLWADVLFAQQGGTGVESPARPKVKSEGTVSAEGKSWGYGVKYYFQEGKTFEDEDAHVYHEPVMHLLVTEVEEETEDGLEIENHIDDKRKTLSLYLRWYEDAEEIKKAVRDAVLKSAKKASNTKIQEGTTAYRIEALEPDASWLQPVRLNHLKSRPLQTNHKDKRIVVVFDDIEPAEAEELVEALEDGSEQLVFNYEFAGVSDERCTAKLSANSSQHLDEVLGAEGESGEDFVTRDKALDIADRIARSARVEGRCADPDWLDRQVEQLIQMLDRDGPPEQKVTSWQEVFEILGEGTEKLLKAAVVEKIRKEAKNEEIIAKREGRWTDEKSRKSGGGLAFLLKELTTKAKDEAALGFKGKIGLAHERSSADAKKKLENIVTEVAKENSINLKWRGSEIIPLSVDVYSRGSVESTWQNNREIKYDITAAAPGGGKIQLTRSSWLIIKGDDSYKVYKDVHERMNALQENLDEIRGMISRDSDDENTVMITARGDGGDVVVDAQSGVRIIAKGDGGDIPDDALDDALDDDVGIDVSGGVGIIALGDDSDVGIIALGDDSDVVIDAEDEVIIGAYHVVIGTEGDVEIDAQNDVEIKARDDVRITARVDRKDNNFGEVRIKARNDRKGDVSEVQIKASKFSINDEPYISIDTCYYELKKSGGSDTAYYNLKRDDDVAAIAGFYPSSGYRSASTPSFYICRV